MEGVDGLLDAAKKAFEITSLQYDKGAASLTDYLDAYRTFVATQTEQYADLTNYWTAVYQVEQAVGMEIR
jgi:outer membrane protein, heavy metal efflux system